jgi:hypothetical protein
MDTIGTMNGFLINDFNRTGGIGKRTDLGEDKKPGASRDIHLEHKHTRRDYDNKDNSNINRGLRFRNISNIFSNKDNHKGLKKNLEEGRRNIESRLTKGLEKWSSVISVG